MTRLFITRHGQTEWNLEGRMQGQKDSKLTELGKRQAEWLGERLKEEKIDIIISSSSGRAITTSKLIRDKRNIEIVSNDKLREIYLGQWEGRLHTEIERLWEEERRNFWHFPHLYNPVGGETFSEVLDRVSGETEKIISEYEGKNILIVTHAIVLKALITYFENKDLKDFWSGEFMHSTCLNILEIKKGNRKFVLKGDTSHYCNVEESAI